MAGEEGAHVLVGLDGAVGQGLELSREQVGARQEARTHDGVIDLVLAGGGHHGDAIAVFIQAELSDHLAEGELDAVLGILGLDLLRDGSVEVFGQRAVEAVDEDGVHTRLAELLDELRANVARADDGDGGRFMAWSLIALP